MPQAHHLELVEVRPVRWDFAEDFLRFAQKGAAPNDLSPNFPDQLNWWTDVIRIFLRGCGFPLG